MEAGQDETLLAEDLPQGLYTVQQSGFSAAGDPDACWGNLKFIALPAQAGALCLKQANSGMGGVGAPVDQQGNTGLLLQLSGQKLGVAIGRRTTGGVQGNSVLVANAVCALLQLQLLRLRNLFHGRSSSKMRRFGRQFACGTESVLHLPEIVNPLFYCLG